MSSTYLGYVICVVLCVEVSGTSSIYVICVVCVWQFPAHILFTLLVLFVCGCVQHVLAFLCCILVYLIYVICVVFVWLCPAHILFTLLVLFMWLCPAHILFTLFVLFVCGGVQHVLVFLCCIFVYLIYVISVVCVWLCPARIGFFCCIFVYLIYVISVVCVWLCPDIARIGWTQPHTNNTNNVLQHKKTNVLVVSSTQLGFLYFCLSYLCYLCCLQHKKTSTCGGVQPILRYLRWTQPHTNNI